jgi:hypothetical protein
MFKLLAARLTVSSLQYHAHTHLPRQPRDVLQKHSPPQHARDSGFLLLMVAAYLLALAGGIVLLGLLTPVSHPTLVATSEPPSQLKPSALPPLLPGVLTQAGR